MPLILSLISLAIGLLACWFSRNKDAKPDWSFLGPVAAVLLLTLVTQSGDSVTRGLEGVGIAAILLAASSWLGTDAGGFALGIGTVALVDGSPEIAFPLCAVLGFGATITKQPRLALGAFVLTLLYYSASAYMDEVGKQVAPMMGLLASLLSLAPIIMDKQKEAVKWLGYLVFTAVVGGVAGALVRTGSPEHKWMLITLSSAVVPVLLLLQSDISPRLRSLLCAGGLIGLATAAYSFGKSEGLAIGIFLACATCAAIGGNVAINAAVAMLAIFAAKAENGSTKYMELSQIYGMSALLAGLLVPSLAATWQDKIKRSSALWQAILGAFVGSIALLVQPILAVIGAWFAGCGFSGLASEQPNDRTAGWALGIFALAFYNNEKLAKYLSDTRDHKVMAFGVAVTVLVAVGWFLMYTSKDRSLKEGSASA